LTGLLATILRYSRVLQRSNTLRIKDDIVHWFSMGIRDASVLERAPKTQEIKLRWKDYADLKRKFKWIEESRGGCKFNVTSVNDQPENEHYINFEFFVSATRHELDSIPIMPTYHIGLSTYPVGTDLRRNIVTRLHPVELKGYSGSMWVRVTKILGKLDQHAVLIFRA
jgi:hypothetical protein